MPYLSQYPLTAVLGCFKGITVHSGSYKNAKEWKGKHGVVVGSGNTGKCALLIDARAR